MEPPPADNNHLHDEDGLVQPANRLGRIATIGINHDDGGRYEPLPPHHHRGVYHHPAPHLPHHAQQHLQLQHHGHGGGSGGQQQQQQHPEQQQQQHHSLISPPPPHYGYPHYNNYAHHHQPHQHHAAAAATTMNYQTYPTTYPPTQYHHPLAASITYQYDAPPRPGAAATAASTTTTMPTPTSEYPQYYLQQSEYLHQHPQHFHHQYHHPPPLPPQHREVPPPHPTYHHPVVGGDTERHMMKDVQLLKQQIRQPQLQQNQQQQQMQADEQMQPDEQMQADEVVVVNEQRAPPSDQKEMQSLVEAPDSTLDQPKPVDIPDSTGDELGTAENEPATETQQHEKEAVASDSSADVDIVETDAVDSVTKTLQEDERLDTSEDKNKEDEEDPTSPTTGDVGQSPIPASGVATVPKTSLSKSNEQDEDKVTHSTEKVFPFDTILTALQEYESKYETRSMPTSHPTFIDIVSNLVQHGIEDEADSLWEMNFTLLKEYKERVGDCDVPFTANVLGPWVVRQRELYAKQQLQQQQQQQQQDLVQTSSGQPTTATEIHKLYISRFERLTQLGFDFNTPMWDVRLQELIAYKSIHNHCSPPVSYPKLGIWTINQRFNLKDMPKERVEALDSLGFVWNHNRKNRSQEKWDGRYEELREYQKQNGHCNVPATYRHSPLGTWVGKQREEYKKLKDKKSSQLDKYRIDKLNEIGFQWSLLNWTTVSWDDRFEALKAFKEQHGHVKIPRNHPDFGNWPLYQKSQYKLFKEGKKSKLTKEKVDKLIHIGFLESKETLSLSAQATAASVYQTGGDYDAGYE